MPAVFFIFHCSLFISGRAFERPAAQSARQSRTLDLPRDGTLSIEATIGEVTVEAWDRPETTVEIVCSGRSAQDLDRLPATIELKGSRAEVRALQADQGVDPSLRSAITVRTPAEVAVDALALFEGRVTVRGLTRLVRASLKRGPLDASGLAGTVRLETSIGDLTLRDARVTPGGLLRLRAFNGTVRLHLAAAPADARILAMTFNGTIRSDIALTLKTAFGPRFGEATIGRGEPLISIDVVTGDIAIEVGKK